MKTKKFSKKLALNKKTIADLESATLKNIKGGIVIYTGIQDDPSCLHFTCAPNCTYFPYCPPNTQNGWPGCV